MKHRPRQVRVVSWGRYAGHLAGRTTNWLFLGFMFFVAALGLSVVVLCVCLFFTQLPKEGAADLLAVASVIAFVGGLCLALAKIGLAEVKQMRQTEAVVPPTARVADHLPATETLVRASAEPEVSQKSVLLRAACATAETPAEQLLRPGDIS